MPLFRRALKGVTLSSLSNAVQKNLADRPTPLKESVEGTRNLASSENRHLRGRT